jgi:uncharacterized RmlC-like cupin family protein
MPDEPLAAPPQAEARVVKPLQFDDNTTQTDGMHRLAAVSRLLVGSEKLWAGVMMAGPNTTSSVHHHGAQETVVYVAEGRGTLRWGRRLEHQTDLEAGDFLFVPAFLPHQEINPSPDQHALWIVVRSGPEAVVVDLALGAAGEYVSTAADAARPASPQGKTTPRSRGDSASAAGVEEGRRKNNQVNRHQLISLALLAVSAVAALVGGVFGELWLSHAVRGWPVIMLAAILAVVAVLDLVWARHARTARRLAVLDAYAQREIARGRARPGQATFPRARGALGLEPMTPRGGV